MPSWGGRWAIEKKQDSSFRLGDTSYLKMNQNEKITIVLSVIAIVVAIIIYWLQRKKRSISYAMQPPNELLQTKDTSIAHRVTLMVDGSPARNVHLIQIKLVNDGNDPVKTIDYEESVSFDFGPTAQVLATDVARLGKQVVSTEIWTAGSILTLTPCLLNPRDNISLSLLVRGYEQPPIVRARIVGITSVKNISDRPVFVEAIDIVLFVTVGLSISVLGLAVITILRFGFLRLQLAIFVAIVTGLSVPVGIFIKNRDR